MKAFERKKKKKTSIPIPLKKCVKRGKKNLMIWTDRKEHAVTPPTSPDAIC